MPWKPPIAITVCSTSNNSAASVWNPRRSERLCAQGVEPESSWRKKDADLLLRAGGLELRLVIRSTPPGVVRGTGADQVHRGARVAAILAHADAVARLVEAKI